MGVMDARRRLMMVIMKGTSEMELIKTYTVPESWENDTKGNPKTIINTIFTASETQQFSYDDYLLLVVENNYASQYTGNYIVSAARESEGFCVRQSFSQIRNVAASISFWVSSGATIKVYKGSFAQYL